MNWRKLGRIIEPRYGRDWMVSHAMDPVADHRAGDIYRVYFSGREAQNRSLIGYVDIDLSADGQVVHIPEGPALGLGELGCFDDNGVTPSSIVNVDGTKYLYYIGWKPRSTTRFGLMTGLARSVDGGDSFQRMSRAPVLQLTDREPFAILTAPCVLKEGDLWRMWYVSCVGWVHGDLPRYNIKLAESRDGILWEQSGHVCIDFQSDDELALARPCVLHEDGRYRMWYCFKLGATPYRMGYAESEDGLRWKRMDDAVGIGISDTGWDSEMIAYPFVFNHRGSKYMLYNGNGYGANGAGLAILEQ